MDVLDEDGAAGAERGSGGLQERSQDGLLPHVLQSCLADKSWSPKSVSLGELVVAAEANIANGSVDQTFTSFLYQALLQPDFGGAFYKTDNELLASNQRAKTLSSRLSSPLWNKGWL